MSKTAYASGTTSATVTLEAPPGRFGLGGPTRFVIDSIHVGIYNTSQITAGSLEVLQEGSGVFMFFNGFTAAASACPQLSYEFPQGLHVPGDPASAAATGTVTVVAGTFTGAANTRCVVTYHYDNNQGD